MPNPPKLTPSAKAERPKLDRQSLRDALPPRDKIAPNCPVNGLPAHNLLDLLDIADERDRLRVALTNEVVRMEYDYPGDAPEECGLWCHLCNEHVEEDGSGHKPDCLLVGCAPVVDRRNWVSTKSKRKRRRGDMLPAAIQEAPDNG